MTLDYALRRIGFFFLAAGPELIAEYKEQFGLDKPVYEQYVDYVVQLAQGNLGYSVTNFPTNVTTLIGDALPWTLGLLLTAMLISWIVGSILGGLLAWRSTPALARGLMSAVMLFAAIPYYLVALFLLYVFAYKLQWLPTGGSRDALGTTGGPFAPIIDTIEHGP